MSSVTTIVTVSTVHPGPSGGAVFAGQDAAGRRVRAVADRNSIVRAPLRGEVWQLTGRFSKHPKYGEQLYVEQSKLFQPTGRLLIRYLAVHPSFRGIGVGQAKASRLYEEFGDQLTEILNRGETSRVATVLGDEVACKLVSAWKESAQQSAVVAFLDRHGVDPRLAGKILRYWPEGAIEKLRENPYRLLILIPWHTADRIAMSLGVDRYDERRLISAAEASVYERLDIAKDTLVKEADLRSAVNRLLRPDSVDISQRAIELAVADGTVAGSAGSGYQPYGCVVMEQYLVNRFSAMIGTGRKTQIPLFGGEVGREIIDLSIRAFESEGEMRLNDEQRSAVRMACTEPLSVLTGGAGVGKTTVLKAIHCAAESLGGAVLQMALAGRAAQRMREATGRDAYTIAGFLNQVCTGKIKLGIRHLVIVDESSMLDLMLVYRMLRALPDGVRILFVGDPHQLPPIGPGLVFHKLAESNLVPAQELTQVHRQSESTGIPAVAKLVRDGVVPELPCFSGSEAGVSFLRCNTGSVLHHLVDIMGELGGFGDSQILGVTKGGPAGVAIINHTFHQKLTSARRKLPEWGIAELEPIVFTVNDYGRELYNGSLGLVEKVFPEPCRPSAEGQKPTRVVCNFDGRKIDLPDEDLGNVELAYAVTTHKAQGSQFRRVVIPISKSRLLDRTLIYTALTRGVEQVVFLGDKNAFNSAIVTPPLVSTRNTGFSL